VNAASVNLDGSAGVDVMLVSGAARSTAHVCVAGVGSVFPAGSVARTANVCGPSESPVRLLGEPHEAQAPLSSRHSKVDPLSVEMNEKVAEVALVGSVGADVIAVSGTEVSTNQPTDAGVGSVFPAASVARTSNVCGPSATPA
jgi:hypothetical protein